MRGRIIMRPKGSASEPRESVLRDRKSPDQTTQPPEEQAPPPQAGKTTKTLSIQPKTAPVPPSPATFIDRPGAAADLEKGEAESRKHQELLQLFVEHTPAAVAMFDREMRYVLVTDRWLINHKLSKEDVLGRWHYDVFPRVPERWKQIHQRVLAGGPAEKCEEDCVQRADGS